jgi:protein transport protein SEC61 subunit alpha
MGKVVCNILTFSSFLLIFIVYIVINSMQAEQRVIPAQPDSIAPNQFVSHILKAARLGGFCVGTLIILGDFIGVFGSGTGIMLAVSALYPYFDGRAGEVGAFGF